MKTIEAYLRGFFEEAPSKVIAKILQRIADLAVFPRTGKCCEYDGDYLQLTVGDYWVLYKVDQQREAVETHYILDSTRDIARILETKDRSFIAQIYEDEEDVE